MLRRQILVIDDDPYVLQILKLCLGTMGDFVIQYAPDGPRGLRLVAGGRPDLILLDYDLPGTDGLETLERLRSDGHLGATPIVAMTGALRLSPRCRELIVRCDGYIAKPFEFEQLRHTVLKMLTQPPAQPAASDWGGPLPQGA